MMGDALQNYEEGLTGGYEHGVLHWVTVTPKPDDPPNTQPHKEIVMFMMDMEYDPVRITFESDGAGAYIHADGNKWTSFTAHQLRFIADMSAKAFTMWEQYFIENPEE